MKHRKMSLLHLVSIDVSLAGIWIRTCCHEQVPCIDVNIRIIGVQNNQLLKVLKSLLVVVHKIWAFASVQISIYVLIIKIYCDRVVFDCFIEHGKTGKRSASCQVQIRTRFIILINGHFKIQQSFVKIVHVELKQASVVVNLGILLDIGWDCCFIYHEFGLLKDLSAGGIVNPDVLLDEALVEGAETFNEVGVFVVFCFYFGDSAKFDRTFNVKFENWENCFWNSQIEIWSLI